MFIGICMYRRWDFLIFKSFKVLSFLVLKEENANIEKTLLDAKIIELKKHL